MEQGDNQYQSGGAMVAPPLKTTKDIAECPPWWTNFFCF